MRKFLLLFFLTFSLFAAELWQQKYKLENLVFKKELALLKNKKFDNSKFDFFYPVAQKLGIVQAFESLKNSDNLDSFIKAKVRFFVQLENSAFEKKEYELIDFQNFDIGTSKDILFGAKIKKYFLKLEKSSLQVPKRDIENLLFIKEYMDALDITYDKRLFDELFKDIRSKNLNKFYKDLNRLQLLVLKLKSKKLSQKEVEEAVRSFLRYNKLTAFDFKNGVDEEGNIKNSLEYTEAVIFSARAKEKILELAANISNEELLKLLEIYQKIIENIKAKRGKKEVQKLTKEAKKIVLKATGLKEIKETPSQLVANVKNSLKAMMDSVQKNDFKTAEFFRLESYSFFDPDIEGRLIPRDPKLAAKLEGLFWDGYENVKGLAYAIKQKDKNLVYTAKQELEAGLDEAQKILETKLSFGAAILQSAMIIIREGMEALLVIAILLSLFSAKRPKIYLFLGVLLGIAASIATYYAAKEIISISTSNRELIEGISALIASAMLIFVTAWIFHNTYVKGWVEYAKELSEKSLQSGSLLTLLFVGFIVVYREGFETVLFYETLANESDPKAVLFGFLAGLGFILLISALVIKGIKKLPVHLLFGVTGLFLSILAVIFTGAGIRGLQTANIISATPSPYLKDWHFLRDYFGYSPTVETTISQITLFFFLLVFYIYKKYKGVKKVKSKSIDNNYQFQA